MDKNEKIVIAIGAVIGAGIWALVENIKALRNMNKKIENLEKLCHDIAENESKTTQERVCHEG